MTNRIHISLTTILLIGCVFLLLLYNKSCNKINEAEQFESMYYASQDSLHKKINKDGTEETTTALILGSIENFKQLRAHDSTAIGRLQKIVDRLTISATIFSTVTQNSTSSNTTSVTSRDTVVKDSLVYIYPEYKTSFSNKWEDFEITANKDTFLLNYKTFNDFEFEQKWEKQGLFKRKVAQVTGKNNNPHTQTVDLKVFTVQPDKKSRWKNIALGLGTGLIVGYVAFNNK